MLTVDLSFSFWKEKLSVTASMQGLSCSSSARVHTLILLRVSEERMVVAGSHHHLNSVSWFSAHSSSSVSITVIDFLNSTISGNSLHRKQDKRTWMLAGAEPKFWKILALTPQHQIGNLLHSWWTKWTGKDKANPYHFPSHLSLVFSDSGACMFYPWSECKMGGFSS